MRLKVGEIEIEAPDSMEAADFVKLVQEISIRLAGLINANIDIKRATPTTTVAAPVTTTTLEAVT